MKRLGSTTLEIMIVVAMTGATLSLIAGLLATMIRADADARIATQEQRELNRLAARFRADAHSATVAAASGDALTFNLPENRSIEYVTNGGRVDRLVRAGDAPASRDSFKLSDDRSPVDATVRFEREKVGEASSMAAIVVDWTEVSERRTLSPHRTARLEASVGRDERLRKLPNQIAEATREAQP